MNTPKDFKAIVTIFESNIRALRALNDRIGALADEHDKALVLEFSQKLANVLDIGNTQFADEVLEEFTKAEENDAVAQVSITSTSEEKSGTEETVLALENGKEEVSIKESFLEVLEFIKEQPGRARQFAEVLKSTIKQPAAHGYLLRRGALVTLVSYFETLLSELIHAYYLRYPAGLPSEDRLLSLNDLRSLGSIEEAEKYVIGKEAELVLRKNLDEQLDYFTRRLKIDLAPLKEHAAFLSEIIQRRNIFVHNDGIVNRIYLSQVPISYASQKQIVDGQRLQVSKRYLAEAIETIYTIGSILIQQCWRKWEKDEGKQADDSLIDLVYESLVEQHYTLTQNLARFASSIKFKEDASWRVIVVNHAIALREIGKCEEMERLLSGLDWSACSIKFHVATSILRGDKETALLLLPKAIAAGEVSLEAMRQWPIFKYLRNDERFETIAQEHFKQ